MQWVIVAILLSLVAVYAIKRITDLPGDLLKDGTRTLRSVAEAMHQGRITHTFISYATSVTGASRLQFATQVIFPGEPGADVAAPIRVEHPTD